MPNGISVETFLRLLPDASIIFRYLLSKADLLVDGVAILCFRDKYCPVRLFLFFFTSRGVPVATICPPSKPAAGPRSIK